MSQSRLICSFTTNTSPAAKPSSSESSTILGYRATTDLEVEGGGGRGGRQRKEDGHKPMNFLPTRCDHCDYKYICMQCVCVSIYVGVPIKQKTKQN